ASSLAGNTGYRLTMTLGVGMRGLPYLTASLGVVDEYSRTGTHAVNKPVRHVGDERGTPRPA
ncbi:MAG: hypothetical protein KDI19_13365, partial [Pseudomonadales bacterium]|nr:hypothetical protein [Pseudomonadales bacterium]